MKHRLKRSSLLLLAFFLTFALNAVAITTRYVNGVHGSDSNNCTSSVTACKTIRQAISRSSSGDSIVVAAATYAENLSIGFNLTIAGASARTTIIDGGQTDSVIAIASASAHVTLSKLTLRNGSGVSHGGGGIYNLATLTISDSTVSGNSSTDLAAPGSGLGGGIYNAGTLTINRSTVSGNKVSRLRMGSSAAGGGIYNTGRLTAINTTVSANQASDNFPAGAPSGGGIANVNGTVAIDNGTFSKNSATIVTPFGTGAGYGGGISNSGTLKLQNSIIANNNLGGNCHGSVNSLGYNLSSDNTCTFNGPGDQRNINPTLGPLQNNGGPTQTMALPLGSPAINAGNPGGCTNSNGQRLTGDQRGDPRPDPGACDMGAYEHQPN